MWDLNDSPDQNRDVVESGPCSASPVDDAEEDKGKRVGSVSNSSSSAVVLEDGSEEEEEEEDEEEEEGDSGGGGGGGRKRSSEIFGFSVNQCSSESETPVTRQFFPVEGHASVAGGATANFPRAHWVGVKFCQSEPLGAAAAAAGKSTEAMQPPKKSRRGPRSRSSQYRGVTFYRRTGRWESHIW